MGTVASTASRGRKAKFNLICTTRASISVGASRGDFDKPHMHLEPASAAVQAMQCGLSDESQKDFGAKAPTSFAGLMRIHQSLSHSHDPDREGRSHLQLKQQTTEPLCCYATLMLPARMQRLRGVHVQGRFGLRGAFGTPGSSKSRNGTVGAHKKLQRNAAMQCCRPHMENSEGQDSALSPCSLANTSSIRAWELQTLDICCAEVTGPPPSQILQKSTADRHFKTGNSRGLVGRRSFRHGDEQVIRS